MIQRLYIKDFAIIDEVDINLKPGLTVITGETGSGKSILLEAMGVSLGAKADKIMVRTGKNRAVIEIEFEQQAFRRLISDQGRTKAYRNDEPITIGDLVKSNRTAVDFHGQNDQQLILDVNRHIDYLDRFCGHEADVEKIGEIFSELTDLKLKLKNAMQSSDDRKDRLDLLKFQSQEIDAVNPTIGEDHELDKEYKKLSHLEEILKTLQTIQQEVNSGDNSVTHILEQNLRSLDFLTKYDENLKKITDLMQSSMIQLQEAGAEISGRLAEAEFDPLELEAVEERLHAVEGLKRKYGGSIESVLEKRKSIQKEIQSLAGTEYSEEELKKQIKAKELEFSTLAKSLNQTRAAKSLVLSIQIENAMSELNMPGAKFDIRISQAFSENGFVDINGKSAEGNPKGIDIVEFFLSANPGEPVKPLAAIASGGEISRIMLAIKTVFQDLDPVPTLVFDEIDTGISGKAAEKVADQLLKLSRSKQVFCITHLSQIARKADHHLHIDKHFENGRTFVRANYLNETESPHVVNELMMGTETLLT